MSKHPSDIVSQADSIVLASRSFDSWLRKGDNRRALEALVLIYGDDNAKELLDALREDFWGSHLDRK